MTCTLITEPYYFGTQRWSLQITYGRKNPVVKRFFLGQDCKYLSRGLGMDWGYFKKVSGVTRISTDKEKRKVGRFIYDQIGLTPDIVRNLEPWGLSVE